MKKFIESHFKKISSAQFADILRKYVFNRMPVDNGNAGLDKYLSDVILWDENNVDLHLEELTSEEIGHLRQEFENCIIKIDAEIKNDYEHTILSFPVLRKTYFLINAASSL